ncbi:MAG: hypothetical protein Q9227_000174 [Pyrenula ochraceoflavens]
MADLCPSLTSILHLNPLTIHCSPLPTLHPLPQSQQPLTLPCPGPARRPDLSPALSAGKSQSPNHPQPQDPTTNSSFSFPITSAGIARSERALPKQEDPTTPKLMSIETFDLVLSVNLRGTVDLIRHALPHLSTSPPTGPDSERGIIIVVSSAAAYSGQVGQLAYSASKGAIASLVLPLAREIGPSAGIRAVGIAPAVFHTNMSLPGTDPSGAAEEREQPEAVVKRLKEIGLVEWPPRMGKGEEFARLVGEIVGNSMLNGTVVHLDGAVRFPSKM